MSDRKPEEKPKLTYSSPKLKVFGPVGMLTQSGTGPMVERGNSMSAKQERP
jgi:hypothetical protein